MRVKIRELMESHHLTTGYQLAQFSGGRIKLRTAHALVKADGRLRQFNGGLLEALWDTFALKSWDQLLER